MTSPPPLRPYQSRACDEVEQAWRSGTRRVCLVLPTGGGKTRTAVELVSRIPAELHPGRKPRALWLANRTELLDQAAGKLREAGADVAVISPNHPPDPWAAVQVASLDTLVARQQRPAADLVVMDECQHAGAETYADVLQSYADTLHLGLTATPQRQDGKPLAGYYDHLVVGAQYSELLAIGALVPCRVRRAPEYLGSDLAREPLLEWQAYGGNRLTFAFAPTVTHAENYAKAFNEAGIPSAVIHGKTSAFERRKTLAQFRCGKIRVLWNVYVLTEGVDVPEASCILLARGVSHAGPYLQICGRGLRPAPGKADCILLDMSGASWLHHLPTEDRIYSLDGRAIGISGEALKNCPQCGAILPSAQPECPDCGYVFEKKERRLPKIWDMELQWAVAEAGGLENVGADAKRREWERLMSLVETRPRWSVGFAKREFEKLFEEKPPDEWVKAANAGVRMRELVKLVKVATEKGYKPGWIGFRYKNLFHRWPSSAELEAAREALRKEVA